MAVSVLPLIALVLVTLHAGNAARTGPELTGRKLKNCVGFLCPALQQWHGDGPHQPSAPVRTAPSVPKPPTKPHPPVLTAAEANKIRSDCRNRGSAACNGDVTKYENAEYCPKGQVMCCSSGNGYSAYAGATKGTGANTKADCREMKCRKQC